jgi:beta-galactosidase
MRSVMQSYGPQTIQMQGYGYNIYRNVPMEFAPYDSPHVPIEFNPSGYYIKEFLIPETVEALAYYDHPFFSHYPAVTINSFGKGTLLYEGSIFSDQIQARIIKEALGRAGISDPDHQYSWPIIAKSGTNDQGNGIHFYYNYSSDPAELSYPHPSGKELVSENKVGKGDPVSIEPWGVIIIEEND